MVGDCGFYDDALKSLLLHQCASDEPFDYYKRFIRFIQVHEKDRHDTLKIQKPLEQWEKQGLD